MRGYVLGQNGNISEFVKTLYRVQPELTDREFDLLQALVQLAVVPGGVVNMAEKLNLSSVELTTALRHLRQLGLIDYWSGGSQATTAKLTQA